MQTYTLGVADRALTLESDDSTLVRTSVGVDQVTFRFYSSEWLDFTTLSAAFYVGETLEEVSVAPSAVTGEDWLAEATVTVPASVLAVMGAMGVTVHGTNADNDHIITEQAFPLTVVQEGET